MNRGRRPLCRLFRCVLVGMCVTLAVRWVWGLLDERDRRRYRPGAPWPPVAGAGHEPEPPSPRVVPARAARLAGSDEGRTPTAADRRGGATRRPPGGGPKPAPGAPPTATWAEPVAGACPPGYPVKVKLRSGLYHLPGMNAYGRTSPDRCYPSAPAAEADGFTRARR